MRKLKNGGYQVTLYIGPDYGRAILDNWDRWGTHSGPDDYLNGILNTALMYEMKHLLKETGVWYGHPDAPNAQGADKVIHDDDF